LLLLRILRRTEPMPSALSRVYGFRHAASHHEPLRLPFLLEAFCFGSGWSLSARHSSTRIASATLDRCSSTRNRSSRSHNSGGSSSS